MEIKMRVREFLGKFFNESEVGDEDNIFQQGLVNSLFAMQLVNFVEKEFEVSVENDELAIENFKSISAISKFINSKM